MSHVPPKPPWKPNGPPTSVPEPPNSSAAPSPGSATSPTLTWTTPTPPLGQPRVDAERRWARVPPCAARRSLTRPQLVGDFRAHPSRRPDVRRRFFCHPHATATPTPSTGLAASVEALSAPLVSGNLPFVVANAPDAWTVLGDPTRRRIVERLAAAPCSVAQLANELPVSRPAVSQHLRLLKDAGLVNDEAEGTRRVYSIDAARLDRYRRELDGFWATTLKQFTGVTEEQ